MARLNNHHQLTAPFGEGKCSVPMWMHGLPAGFCDEPAYGPQTKEYLQQFKYTTTEYHRPAYAPALACIHHGGPTRQEASPKC